jgi:aryl carrier-like protein
MAQIALLANFVSHASPPDKAIARLTRATLAAASNQERSDLLRSYLAHQVAQVLRVTAAELNLGEPLTYLGLDSLLALELRNRIASDLQLSVPVTQLLEGPSINDLQVLLLGQVDEATTFSPEQQLLSPVAAGLLIDSEQDASAVLAQLDEMSEENIDLLLERLLAEERLH